MFESRLNTSDLEKARQLFVQKTRKPENQKTGYIAVWLSVKEDRIKLVAVTGYVRIPEFYRVAIADIEIGNLNLTQTELIACPN